MKKVVIIASILIVSAGCAKPAQPAIKPLTNSSKNMLQLTSSAFKQAESIPKKYTCQGDNSSPPLVISGVPQNAKSLVLIMDDPDVPKNLKPDGVFDHWVVYNMPAKDTVLEEGKKVDGIMGSNSRGKVTYTGPCPPDREHRYFFRVYALDIVLENREGLRKQDVLEAIQGHIIDQAELMGRYIKE